jgi:predicted metal-dependent hydrolase
MEYGSKSLGKISTKTDSLPGSNQEWGSHFWQGLMEVKKFFWQHCRVQVGNGARTRFW